MTEANDRRATKKARTREDIRRAAQRLFDEHGFEAVTVAAIAAAADVAVQTVFNHFPTKEEIFFADRAPWVLGPAAAVRACPPQVPALTALRQYLVGAVTGHLAHATQADQRFVEAIEASPALQAYERELVHESERRLSEALAGSWAESGSARLDATASVVAAMWLATVRAVVMHHRPLLSAAVHGLTATGVARTLDRLLAHLDAALGILDGVLDGSPPGGSAGAGRTGWPPAPPAT